MSVSANKKSVYCAGPLFTEKEREEMLEMALAFEKAGFVTFLPQRDGLELTRCSNVIIDKGVDETTALNLLSRAIFALDVYQVVVACDAVAVNLNGRVPDEGAVTEAALAWCANKIVVAYKADSRSVLMGRDNPLVLGLFDFKPCETIPDLIEAIVNAFEHSPAPKRRAENRGRQIKHYLELGAQIWDALRTPLGVENVAHMLCRSFFKVTDLNSQQSEDSSKEINSMILEGLGGRQR